PDGTKWDPSEMWTHARKPSPSRATEMASSKSFAVSGSIVKVSRSVRSRRAPASGTDGTGGCEPRSPRSTSRPSSADSMWSAGPRIRSTRARPLLRTTAASWPARAPPSVLRSRWIGTPGVKNGSPTSCRPRRASSTTTSSAVLDAQEAPEGEARPGGAEQQAGPDDDQRVQVEHHRVRVLRVRDVQPGQCDGVAEEEQDEREQGPGEPAEERSEER